MIKDRVEFDEIQKAMEDTDRDAFDYFLDKETGDVVILSEDIIRRAQEHLAAAMDDDEQYYDTVEFDEEINLPDWMEDEIGLALKIFLDAANRYIRIPERDPNNCHATMTSFARQLPDNEFKDQLLTLLDGPGAFRRFKDALASHPRERKQWFRYNARSSHEEINKWLTAVLSGQQRQDL